MLKDDFCKGHQHHNQLQGMSTKRKASAKQVKKGASMQPHVPVVHCHVPAPKGPFWPFHTTPRAGTKHGCTRTANTRNTRNSWQQPAGGCPRAFLGSLGMQQSQFLTATLLDKFLLESCRSLGFIPASAKAFPLSAIPNQIYGFIWKKQTLTPVNSHNLVYYMF